MRKKIKLPPTILVIFGGSGDLTNRKLIPALYNLFLENQLPEKFTIIGLGRTEYSDEEFRKHLSKGMDEFSRSGASKDEEWDSFKERIQYQSADLFDDQSYQKLAKKLQLIGKDWKEEANTIFYFAISPHLIQPVAKNIGRNNLCDNRERTRIVVEKPFGNDLESAQNLNRLLTKIFREEQIYRIDHYLGKEAVQNMLVFRSEEHTSELQSRGHLVCRLLLEKKKTKTLQIN